MAERIAGALTENGRMTPSARGLLIGGGASLVGLAVVRRTMPTIAAGVAGAALIYRGVRGGAVTQARRITVDRAMTVRRSRADVYEYWRRLENLPRHMRHLAEVRTLDGNRSRWSFDVPATHGRLEWTAEIARDDEGRFLSWRSLPGSDVETTGEVRFEDAPGGRGTEIHVHLEYRPPNGQAGHLAARALNPAFRRMVGEDVRRIKHILEAGEEPSNDMRRTNSPNARGTIQ